MNKWYLYSLILVLIIYLLAKYIFIFNKYFWTDELGFICRAKLLLSGYKLYGDLLTGKPPLIHIFLAGIVYLYYNILNIPLHLMYFTRIIFLIIYLLNVYLACIILRSFINDKKIIFLCCYLFLFDSYLFHLSGMILIEPLANLLVLLSIYLLILFERKKDIKLIILSLICVNLTVVLKQYYLILPLFILLYLIKKKYFNILKILKFYTISLTIYIFVFSLIFIFCDFEKFIISYLNGGRIVSSHSFPSMNTPEKILIKGFLFTTILGSVNSHFLIFIIELSYSGLLFIFSLIYLFEKIREKALFTDILANILIYCYTYLIILYIVLGGLNKQYFFLFREIFIITAIITINKYLNPHPKIFCLIYIFLIIASYTLMLFYLDKITSNTTTPTLNEVVAILDEQPSARVYTFKTDICGWSDYYLTKYNYMYIKAEKIPCGYEYQKVFLNDIKTYNISVVVCDKKTLEKLFFNVNCSLYLNLTIYNLNNTTYSLLIFSNNSYKKYIFSKNCSRLILPKNINCINVNSYTILIKNLYQTRRLRPPLYKSIFCLDCSRKNCYIKINEIKIMCGYLNYTIMENETIYLINVTSSYCVDYTTLGCNFLKSYNFRKVYEILSKNNYYIIYQKIN